MEEVKCYDSEVANHKLREINVFNYHEDLSPFISEKDELSEREKAETLQIDDFERKLVEIICQDDSTQLICLAKQNSEKSEDSTDQETLDPGVAARLLQLACRLDSVECATVLIEGDTGTVARINEMDAFGRTPLHNAAELHAKKCIDLLLRKNCRTDIRSKDRDALLALEIALFSKRMQVDWSPKESVEELLVLLRERDLSAMRLLAEATKEVGEVAYMRAMEGRIVELAVLLLVAADKITMPVTNHFECYSITKSARSVYDCVLEETLALGEREKRALRPDNQDGCSWDSACSIHERREFFLRGIELLQMFGAVAQAAENTCKEKKVLPPLLRASRIGDVPVVKLLLQSGANVNETDANGNSSLHWCIKRGATSQDLRLTWLLLKHGAKVSQRNRLGLTPVHVAAAKGNYYTLQMLLLQDPECVDIASEAQETPLFFAVKSEFLGCAKLLLSHGANRQALNLLRQRPIEYAKSQDMHFLLHSTNQRFLNSLSLREDDDFCSANKELNQGVNDESPETEHEPTDTDRMLNSTHRDAKTWVCHFYDSSKGRARGARCYYVHGATKLRQLKFGPPKLKPIGPSRNLTIRTMHPRVMYRKIFVGGLPPSVDSDYLKEFFQSAFGPVEEATVIGTPTGNHLQSRGFGFVTFEREETVAVAVETHFVTIFGKRVEIKSAVMKYVPEKGATSPSYICRKVLDGTNSESSWWPNSPHCSKTDLQAAELDNQTVTSLSEHNLPQWVTKFRKWLPSFLDEACKRLGEGEWYPLSSLKGDFRATCGLELDHASLGFLKLSDFMRALPGLCKMQVVPVGNGPATHVVLFPLPSGSNHELFQNIGDQQQFSNMGDQQQFSNMGDQQQFSVSTIDKTSDAFKLSQSPIAEVRDRVLLPSKCQPEEKVYIDCTGFKEGKSNTLRSNMLDSIPWRIKTTNLTDVEHPILGRTEKGGALMIPLSEGEGTSRGSMQSPSSSLFQEQWDYCLLAKGRCIICHSRPSTSAIVPCNHKVCNWCISNTSLKKCILCGGEVQRFKPLEGVDPPNYTLSVLENPRLGMRKYPSLPIRQSMARPNFSGHDTACQLKYACQGATATVFCFPCRHRISCLSCLPRCQQNQPVVPKSCPACGGAVTKLESADG